jgi:hypothetical protein
LMNPFSTHSMSYWVPGSTMMRSRWQLGPGIRRGQASLRRNRTELV